MNHVLVPGDMLHNGEVYHLPQEDNPDTPKCPHSKIHDTKYIRKDPDVLPNHRVCKDCSGESNRPSSTGPQLAAKLEKIGTGAD